MIKFFFAPCYRHYGSLARNHARYPVQRFERHLMGRSNCVDLFLWSDHSDQLLVRWERWLHFPRLWMELRENDIWWGNLEQALASNDEWSTFYGNRRWIFKTHSAEKVFVVFSQWWMHWIIRQRLRSAWSGQNLDSKMIREYFSEKKHKISIFQNDIENILQWSIFLWKGKELIENTRK